jgi:hypothetical protein
MAGRFHGTDRQTLQVGSVGQTEGRFRGTDRQTRERIS